MESSSDALPPNLQSLLNELTKLPVLLEQEIVLHLQRSEPTSTSTAPSASEHEVMQLWEQLEVAKRELQLIREEHQAVLENKNKWDQAVAEAAAQHRAITDEVQASEIRWQNLEQDRLSFETQRTQLAEAQAQLEHAIGQLDTRESCIARREQQVAQLAERFEGTRHWLENLMPGWLADEAIAPWRDALMNDAQHSSTSSNAAGLLFATLSLYSYAQRENDARAVADVLREVGRRLYAWVKECGHDDQLASQIAQTWADAINRECSGRCEVEVPVPGAPALNQTMNFRPRPGVSAQTVATVQFWCVRGAKREVIHRAEVNV